MCVRSIRATWFTRINATLSHRPKHLIFEIGRMIPELRVILAILMARWSGGQEHLFLWFFYCEWHAFLSTEGCAFQRDRRHTNKVKKTVLCTVTDCPNMANGNSLEIVWCELPGSGERRPKNQRAQNETSYPLWLVSMARISIAPRWAKQNRQFTFCAANYAFGVYSKQRLFDSL